MQCCAHYSKKMTSKEISEKLEMSIDTLRYYEKIGIIPEVKRLPNGYREYTERDYNWLYLIKVMRSVGVSLERLSDYIAFVKEGEQTAENRKNILIAQRMELEAKRTEIDEVINRLSQKIEKYDDRILTFENKLKK